MAALAVVGLKPDMNNDKLLELVRSHVRPPSGIHLVSLVPVGQDADEGERLSSAERAAEGVVADLRTAGFRVDSTVQVSVGGVGGDLVRIADDLGASLIVIGLGKRSRVGKVLLGSDAQRVLLGATCPVLVTRLD
jgi:nucleotide-binding universal stress UspA family protein